MSDPKDLCEIYAETPQHADRFGLAREQYWVAYFLTSPSKCTCQRLKADADQRALTRLQTRLPTCFSRPDLKPSITLQSCHPVNEGSCIYLSEPHRKPTVNAPDIDLGAYRYRKWLYFQGYRQSFPGTSQ